ncbi:MAG: hypothetical protein AMXMBFR6_25700 [Betaproteobacteria bacterium]
MTTSDWVEVACAVLERADGQFLLGRRAAGGVYAGHWEFPGGKLEAGETPRAALVRELREELAIEARTLQPWLVREHLYPHAHVRLHFFRIPSWSGIGDLGKTMDDAPQARVHAELAWMTPGAPPPQPMLPANAPVLRALGLARVYALTHATEYGIDGQLARLDQALTLGHRLFLVREPGLPEADRTALARQAVARAHAAGATVLVHASAELAEAVGADGLHWTAAQLRAAHARPPFAWLAASCHDRAELEHAARLGVDFVVLGPVAASASHPGMPGIGWPSFERLAAGLPMPVFALGGLGPGDLDLAAAHGAHGVAGIRRFWPGGER